MKNNFVSIKKHNNLSLIHNSPIIYNQFKLLDECYEKEPIYLITQFYISKHKERYNEIVFCLKRNINLGLFDKIYLINEREYTQREMQLTNEEYSKVQQVVYKRERMTYKHAFSLVNEKNLSGYIVISNSDIFFDSSLQNVYRTCLSQTRSFYTQLRHEYDGKQKLESCKLFGPRSDSQDVWIYHTNHKPKDKLIQSSNFMLGKRGCDNSIVYHVVLDGYILYNQPRIIKCYHFHKTQIRTYNTKDKVPPPYIRVFPELKE